MRSYDIQTAGHRDTLKLLCKASLTANKLIDMGAQIILCDPHRAVVIGHDHKLRLRANKMTSPDIRAGIAMLLAAMLAVPISWTT